MDFVFDRNAEGRVMMCFVILNNPKHEAVAIDVERAISGHDDTLAGPIGAQSRFAPSHPC
ncbi:hypothetical protein FHR47_001352 [Xanthomonas arboricola]|nr:hypothetical protein [Xanthomonas cannabis]